MLADFSQHAARRLQVCGRLRLKAGGNPLDLLLTAGNGVLDGVYPIRQDGNLLLDLLEPLLLLNNKIAVFFKLLPGGGTANFIGDAVRRHILLLVGQRSSNSC